MKTKPKFSITYLSGTSIFLLFTAVAVLITTPLPVSAQQRKLEEVVVTGRKREESLQNVPISVQAISGRDIEARNIIDLDRLAPITPNFNYAQNAGASDTLFMRGIANMGSGPQFEQGVGQVLNGFLTTQGRVGRTNLVDLRQVEVLKGPQGAIIGKNNTLGAVNMETNRPTEEYEVSVSGGWDFRASEGGYLQGIVSGPLHDRVRGRAVFNYQNRDGWVTSRANGVVGRERDDKTARVLLDIDLADNLTAELMWQYTDLEQEGKFREAFACVDPATAMAAGFDCKLDFSNQSENFIGGEDIGEPFLMEQNLYGLTLNWEFDSFTITTKTGFLEYEMFDRFDSSLEPAPIVSRSIDNFEDYDQFTQEARITSNRPMELSMLPGNMSMDYIAGVFYQDDSLDFEQNSNFPRSPGPPIRGGQAPTKRVELGSRDSDVIAGFAQFTFHVTPDVDLSIGGRVTRDERDGQKQQSMNDFNTDTQNLLLCSNNPDSPLGPSGFRVCTNAFELDDDPTNDNLFQLGILKGTTEKTDLSWDASLTWRPFDGTMLYAAAASGFKSAGFDLRATDPNARFVFDSETSRNMEIGGKHTWMNGRLRTNWTAYFMDIDGLQTSSNDPVTISQSAINADANSYGLEYEISWILTEDLNINLVGAFIDTEYDDFIAPCIAPGFVITGQVLEDTCTVDQNGDGAPDGQDMKGKELPFAPNIQFTISADYTLHDVLPDVLPGTDLRLDLDYAWVDDHVTSVDQNPLGNQDSVGLLDASLTLTGAGNRWSVSVIGRNLTDEVVRHVVSNTTACPSSVAVPGGTGTCLFTFTKQKQAIGVQAKYNFF